MKDTKTAEDEEDPGLVPIIRPLRLLLDRVRPSAVGSFKHDRCGTRFARPR